MSKQADLDAIIDRSLIDVRDDGTINYQSIIPREYPDVDMGALLQAVEDNIVEEDGVEDIDWHGVKEDYLGKGDPE